MSNCKACDGVGWIAQGDINGPCATCSGSGSDGREWPHSSSRCPECNTKQGDLSVPDLQPCTLSSELARLRSDMEQIVALIDGTPGCLAEIQRIAEAHVESGVRDAD